MQQTDAAGPAMEQSETREQAAHRRELSAEVTELRAELDQLQKATAEARDAWQAMFNQTED